MGSGRAGLGRVVMGFCLVEQGLPGRRGSGDGALVLIEVFRLYIYLLHMFNVNDIMVSFRISSHCNFMVYVSVFLYVSLFVSML